MKACITTNVYVITVDDLYKGTKFHVREHMQAQKIFSRRLWKTISILKKTRKKNLKKHGIWGSGKARMDMSLHIQNALQWLKKKI